MRTIIITIMSMTLVLAGCGSADETEGSVTTTTVTQSAAPTSDASDISDISALILEEAWNNQSTDDQELMCWGWENDQELMLNSFFAEIDEGLVTRQQAITFFDGKCS